MDGQLEGLREAGAAPCGKLVLIPVLTCMLFSGLSPAVSLVPILGLTAALPMRPAQTQVLTSPLTLALTPTPAEE